MDKYLPAEAASLLKQVITPKCYNKLIQQLDYKDVECLQLAFSKLLGIAIVVGGGLVKLPQILKIMFAGSAKGISMTSYLLETTAYCITLAYNQRNLNPFSTYGETLFVTVQNFIIIFLMLYYKQRLVVILLLTAAFAALNYAIHEPVLVDMTRLAYLQALTIPVSIASKVPQIIANFMQGHTGQLSAFTTFMFFFGSLARVFTTWKEVNDKIILSGFVLATVLNGVLMLQMVLYWGKTEPELAPKKKTK